MIIAEAKKKDSIIEYIIYMWQIEDLIRANNMEMSQIDQNIISKYDQPADKLLDIREWWENLVEMMRLEGKAKGGHLQMNINTVNDLHQLHLTLMQNSENAAYRNQYQMTSPYIIELEMKMSNVATNEIETCLTAIYTSFLLKLQGKEITPATQGALKTISKLLTMLAIKYQQWQTGKLDEE